MTPKDKKLDPKVKVYFKSPFIELKAYDKQGARRVSVLILLHVFGSFLGLFSLILMAVSGLVGANEMFALSLNAGRAAMVTFGLSIGMSYLHRWASNPTPIEG
jgi:hypothetical protein